MLAKIDNMVIEETFKSEQTYNTILGHLRWALDLSLKNDKNLLLQQLRDLIFTLKGISDTMLFNATVSHNPIITDPDAHRLFRLQRVSLLKDFFKQYKLYLDLHDSCVKLNKEQPERFKLINDFFSTNPDFFKTLKFMDLLITPVQRGPRYSLLIKEAKKQSDGLTDQNKQELNTLEEFAKTCLAEANSYASSAVNSQTLEGFMIASFVNTVSSDTAPTAVIAPSKVVAEMLATEQTYNKTLDDLAKALTIAVPLERDVQSQELLKQLNNIVITRKVISDTLLLNAEVSHKPEMTDKEAQHLLRIQRTSLLKDFFSQHQQCVQLYETYVKLKKEQTNCFNIIEVDLKLYENRSFEESLKELKDRGCAYFGFIKEAQKNSDGLTDQNKEELVTLEKLVKEFFPEKAKPYQFGDYTIKFFELLSGKLSGNSSTPTSGPSNS